MVVLMSVQNVNSFNRKTTDSSCAIFIVQFVPHFYEHTGLSSDHERRVPIVVLVIDVHHWTRVQAEHDVHKAFRHAQHQAVLPRERAQTKGFIPHRGTTKEKDGHIPEQKASSSELARGLKAWPSLPPQTHPAVDVQLHGLLPSDPSLQDPAEGEGLVPGASLVQRGGGPSPGLVIALVVGHHRVVGQHAPGVRLVERDLRVVRGARAQVGVVGRRRHGASPPRSPSPSPPPLWMGISTVGGALWTLGLLPAFWRRNPWTGHTHTPFIIIIIIIIETIEEELPFLFLLSTGKHL